MQVGDIVKWSMTEECYHHAFEVGVKDLHMRRRCGIIVDRNSKYYFVLWQDSAILAQHPNSIVSVLEKW